MITDEMIEVASKKCVIHADKDVMCRQILEAAYYLIRAQVLEEAAKACDGLGNKIGAVDGYDYRSGQAIRGLVK